MVVADPGAIVDSSTSNRATANRTGAYGSSGGAEATAEPGAPEALPPGLADGAPVGEAVAAAPPPGMLGDAAGGMCGVTTYTPGRSVPENVTVVDSASPGRARPRSHPDEPRRGP